MTTRIVQEMVVEEVQRFEIEDLLKTHYIRVGVGQYRCCHATVSKIQGDGFGNSIFKHVAIASAIKPRPSGRVAKAKVLDIESCDSHPHQVVGLT